MSASSPVSVTCPHCDGRFMENASFIRPGGSAWCPDCAMLFTMDPADERMRQPLVDAKAARQRRKARRAETRALWSDSPVPAPPRLMGDVLRSLDALLIELDGLTRKLS